MKPIDWDNLSKRDLKIWQAAWQAGFHYGAEAQLALVRAKAKAALVWCPLAQVPKEAKP